MNTTQNSFSLKKNYYNFNPSIENFNSLDEMNEEVKLENLFRKQKISFVWSNVELELVNSLRRTIIGNISTYSIDNVEFFERSSKSETNDSNEFYLYSRKRPIQNNEQIKLRLELLPIKQNFNEIVKKKLYLDNEKTYEIYENKKNSKLYIIKKQNSILPEEYYEKIDITNPNNIHKIEKCISDNLVIEFDILDSKSGDIPFIKKFTENLWLNVNTEYLKCYILIFSFDETLKQIDEKILLENSDIFVENYLITRLKRGQYLKFKANISNNNGSFNSKHTPVCSVSYMIIPTPYLDKLNKENLQELNNIHWSQEQDISENPKHFLFHLQSLEHSTPEDIMELGFENLINILDTTKNIFVNMNEFITTTPKNKFDRDLLIDKKEQEKDNFFIEYYNDKEIRFILINVGFTFIHWFQYRMLQQEVIEFCGYQNPHPKIKEMICYIRFKENYINKIELFIAVIDEMKSDLNKYKLEFSKIN